MTFNQILQKNEQCNKKRQWCSQIGHVVIKLEKKYYISACRLWVGPKYVRT
jgi:hypothetical protein